MKWESRCWGCGGDERHRLKSRLLSKLVNRELREELDMLQEEKDKPTWFDGGLYYWNTLEYSMKEWDF